MDDLNLRTTDDWTPERGLARGAKWGLVAAGVLMVAADLLARYAPFMVLDWKLRGAWALAGVWVLYMVVHHAAGMASLHCSILVAVLTLVIALSQHVVWAYHPVPTYPFKGGQWFSFDALVPYNLMTVLGAGFGLYAWKDGASITSLTDLLGRSPGA
jgi:hypothetical protein